MLDKKAKYITTTLPYVNDRAHMGHALEFVQADTLARYYRLLGHEVFFNIGTDEHGQKIAQKADEQGVDRQENKKQNWIYIIWLYKELQKYRNRND